MAGRTNHRDYWQGFEDYLAGSSYRFPKMKARDGEFTSKTVLGPHWFLVALRNTKRDGSDAECRFIRCGIIIHEKAGPGSAKRRFDRLREFKGEIDKKFGRRLDWDREDERKQAQIVIWDEVDHRCKRLKNKGGSERVCNDDREALESANHVVSRCLSGWLAMLPKLNVASSNLVARS